MQTIVSEVDFVFCKVFGLQIKASVIELRWQERGINPNFIFCVFSQALMFNGIIFFFVAIALFLGFTLYFLICSCYFCSNCFPTKITPRPARSRGLRLVVALFALLSW